MTDRFEVRNGERTMKAVVTTGNGGFDKLVFKDVPVPKLGAGEVLIRVLAAGVNNTEINTRLGWYSSSVTSSTDQTSDEQQMDETQRSDGGWNEATPFPFIQGTDCCGRVEEVADDVDSRLVGERVIVRACMRPNGFDSPDNVWMASDFDGAFAQYVKVPASEAFVVHCDWTDAELASLPCAYGTAENMLHRSGVKAGETVLVAGASGSVGSAVVQLAKRRGAKVIAIVAQPKLEQMAAIGADRAIARDSDLVAQLGSESVDVVVDNVAGDNFGAMLKVLKRRGRFTSSGAIAGPIVSLDMRDFYLKDLTMVGCTGWDEPIFANLVKYVEAGEIKPLVAKEFPLHQIAEAQREFLQKHHVGNFVLIPLRMMKAFKLWF